MPVRKQQSQESNPDSLLYLTQVSLQLQTFSLALYLLWLTTVTTNKNNHCNHLLSIVAQSLYWICSSNSYNVLGSKNYYLYFRHKDYASQRERLSHLHMAKDTCADRGRKLQSFWFKPGLFGGRFSALTNCFYGLDCFFSFAVIVHVNIHGTMSQLHF